MQPWREGKPSLWGVAVRRTEADYQAALHAHKVALTLAQALVEQERAEIARLEREHAAMMLNSLPKISIPAL